MGRLHPVTVPLQLQLSGAREFRCVGPPQIFCRDPRKANSVRRANLGRPSLPSCDGNLLLRKEVIQPHLPVRLPCYDLVPITGLTFGRLKTDFECCQLS